MNASLSLSRMIRRTLLGTSLVIATTGLTTHAMAATQDLAKSQGADHQYVKVAPYKGEIRNVATLDIRPGNVTVTPEGRIFSSIHSMDGDHDVQLIEITGQNSYRAWPSVALQTHGGQYGDDTIDAPLGTIHDGKGGLWVIDMGDHIGKTRLWGFDIDTGNVIAKITLPSDIAPAGSFVQDLAVDRERGVAYLADLAKPGILTVHIDSGKVTRFSDHPSLDAEPDAVMRIDGKNIQFNGQPASVGINPITLSADQETVYFGAMNGLHWYSVPAKLLRDGAEHDEIAAAIEVVGPKPVSDGADTGPNGNHYFTNSNEHGIDVLDSKGNLTPLVRDERLDWPDSVRLASDGWLYISVNQLDKTPPFTGGADAGNAPYHIMKVWAGEQP